MGSQRIASSLINRPYHPPGWGEPALGEEPGEGEDGYTNPPIEDGYSELSDGVIVDMQSTLRELVDNPDLEMNPESFHLQSLGEAIEFNCSPNSGGEYEGQEGGPGESEYIDPLCACEQSLYWATEAGYDCQTLNVIYFYHPDYLGSVEYVTDMRGEPYQFFLNTPWGENLENQFAKNYTSFSSRFRFNGKEWDEETGNFYYGARYYDPKISVWLSVDPLAANYPYISPYNFVENNPLRLIDPTGLGPEDENPSTATNTVISGKVDENNATLVNQTTVESKRRKMENGITVIDETITEVTNEVRNSDGKVKKGKVRTYSRTGLVDAEGNLSYSPKVLAGSREQKEGEFKDLDAWTGFISDYSANSKDNYNVQSYKTSGGYTMLALAAGTLPLTIFWGGSIKLSSEALAGLLGLLKIPLNMTSGFSTSNALILNELGPKNDYLQIYGVSQTYNGVVTKQMKQPKSKP